MTVDSDYLKLLGKRLEKVSWPEAPQGEPKIRKKDRKGPQKGSKDTKIKANGPQVLPKNSGIAAVLVAFCKDPESGLEEILLIKRSGEPGYHSRQIAFPGGFKEKTDADILVTALREAEEEIGLKASDVEILGKLPFEMTVRNVSVFPWVGRIKLPYDFVLNPREVDRLLFLPVDRLIEEGLSSVKSPGKIRGERPAKTSPSGRFASTPPSLDDSLGIKVGDELVWGLTARILKKLREFLLQG